MAKRIFDFIFALVGALVFLPIWALIIIAIELEDGTPIFFIQERVGRNRRIFKIIKFRTMRKERYPHKIVDFLGNDARVTKIGSLLRAMAMDESLQLFNILKGEMSFVGPKPLPYIIEDHEMFRYPCLADVPGYLVRIRVRPGLTGIAQVYARKNILHRNKFRYDNLYVEKHNFFLDIKLILCSFAITFSRGWEKEKRKIGRCHYQRKIFQKI